MTPAADPPPEPGPDDELDGIDVERLTRAVGVSFTPAADPLEPLADDIHHLMRRVHVLEQGQAETLARLDALAQAVGDGARGTAAALDRMNRELLGDRRVAVDRRVLAALAPAADALDDLRAAPPGGDDTPAARQLAALAGVIANALQRVGFTRFEPAAGDPFDPARMEAWGTADGPPGTVVRVLRCGYLYGTGVERTAGVVLARPAADTPADPPHAPAQEDAS